MACRRPAYAHAHVLIHSSACYASACSPLRACRYLRSSTSCIYGELTCCGITTCQTSIVDIGYRETHISWSVMAHPNAIICDSFYSPFRLWLRSLPYVAHPPRSLPIDNRRNSVVDLMFPRTTQFPKYDSICEGRKGQPKVEESVRA